MGQVLATVIQFQLLYILPLVFVGGAGAAEEGNKIAPLVRPTGDSSDIGISRAFGPVEKTVRRSARQQLQRKPPEVPGPMEGIQSIKIKKARKKEARPAPPVANHPEISGPEEATFVSAGTEQHRADSATSEHVEDEPALSTIAELPYQEGHKNGFLSSESDQDEQESNEDCNDEFALPVVHSLGGKAYSTSLKFPDKRLIGTRWHKVLSAYYSWLDTAAMIIKFNSTKAKNLNYTATNSNYFESKKETLYMSDALPVPSLVVEPHTMRLKLISVRGVNEAHENYAKGEVVVYVTPAGEEEAAFHDNNIRMRVGLRFCDHRAIRKKELQIATSLLSTLPAPLQRKISKHYLAPLFQRIASTIPQAHVLREVIQIALKQRSVVYKRALRKGVVGWDSEKYPDVKAFLAERLEDKLEKAGVSTFIAFINDCDNPLERLWTVLGKDFPSLFPDHFDDTQLSDVDIELTGDFRQPKMNEGKISRHHVLVPLGVTPQNQSTYTPCFFFDETVLSEESGAGIYSVIDSDALARRVGRLLEIERTKEDVGAELETFQTVESIFGPIDEKTGDEPEPFMRMVSKGEDGSLLWLQHGRWIPVGQEPVKQGEPRRRTWGDPLHTPPPQSASWFKVWNWNWRRFSPWRLFRR